MRTVDPKRFASVQNIEELHGLIDAAGMGSGWNKPEPAIWSSPKSSFVPAHWCYALAKPALDAAGRFVSTDKAERRNLILTNPLPGNNYATSRTMVAAYQMVEPNETARSHRHTPNALRLVLDAQPGMFTIVNGKKIPMLPGDVVLTPSWSWHGHQNESGARAYWIDVLDVPLVQLLEPMFFESFPGSVEKVNGLDEHSPMRFAWDDTQRNLASQPTLPCGNRTILLGPPSLNSMALYVSRLEAGNEISHERTTANSIFAVIEGSGAANVEDRMIEWRRGDVLVVPAWKQFRINAHTESYVLQVTDEPVFARFDWLKKA
jgi:gentisate 1,2-dioxygenase